MLKILKHYFVLFVTKELRALFFTFITKQIQAVIYHCMGFIRESVSKWASLLLHW